jgi:hypothetical protein
VVDTQSKGDTQRGRAKEIFDLLEPVPKPIDYALTRTVLGQALQFFRLSALQNCEFQGCFPKN